MEVPKDHFLERSLLSAILIDPSVFHDVRQIVTVDDFTDPSHRAIYQAMLSLVAQNKPIDVVILQSHLEANKETRDVAGDVIYLANADGIPTYAKHYADRLHELGTLRRQILAAKQVAVWASSGRYTSAEVFAKTAELFAKLKEGTTNALNRVRPIDELMTEVEEYSRLGERVPWSTTHLAQLDDRIGGYYPGELTVVAARPSIGKTMFATWSAYRIASTGKPVLFVSAEMRARQIAYRMMCAHHYRYTETPFDHESWVRDAAAMRELPVHVFEQGAIRPIDIRAAAVRLAERMRQMPMIIIDYLQLLRATGSYRSQYERISNVSKDIKAIAIDLEVPVLLLAQLNRGPESRPDRMPRVSDLRDSGAIEEDADNVVLLHRRGYYEHDESPVQTMQIDVAKARNGKTGVFDVYVDLRWQSLKEPV